MPERPELTAARVASEAAWTSYDAARYCNAPAGMVIYFRDAWLRADGAVSVLKSLCALDPVDAP